MPSVLVLPTTAAGQQGPVAALMSTAGWAAAAERVLGGAWIVTPSGIVDVAEARRQGSAPHLSRDVARPWWRFVPAMAKTAVRDIRQYRGARRFRVDPDGPWRDGPVDFVWQRHELFHTAGLDLADALGAPSVLFVPALAIWEARRWAVRRPGWGGVLERVGELPALHRADLVACGAPDIAEEAVRLGVPAERVLVVPNGVDVDLFDRPDDRVAARSRLGFQDGELVVGWVGSFRRFHAVERVVEAVAGLDGVAVLFVGDGPERPEVQRLAAERGVRAVFTGTVAHDDLPVHLAAMDLGLVVARSGADFHYSPLKLGEYLAAGLPTVAPDVATVAGRVTDGLDALLVPPGDVHALRRAVVRVRDDAGLRRSLSVEARASARARWSWDDQVRRVRDALDAVAGAGR